MADTLDPNTTITPGAETVLAQPGAPALAPTADVSDTLPLESPQVADYLSGYGQLDPKVQAALLQEAKEEKRKQDLYGSSEGRAALEGAARGLTFGLSDQALVDTGIASQEALRERQARNPVTSALGEYGAIGATALPLGTESVAGKVLQGAGLGIKGVEAAGAGAEALSRTALEKLIADTGRKSIVKKIISETAPLAARGAAEGALFNVGNLVSEDALGTNDFNAENVVASLGVGALLGSAIGGTMGLAKTAAPVAGRAISAVADRVSERASKFIDADEAAMSVAGFPLKKTLQMEARDAALAEKFGSEATAPNFKADVRDYLVNDLELHIADTPEQLARRNAKVLAETGAQIGKTAQKLDELAKTGTEVLPSNAEFYAPMHEQLLEEDKALGVGTSKNKAKIAKVQQYREDVEKFMSTPGEVNFKQANLYLKDLQDTAYDLKGDPSKKFEGRLAERLRSTARQQVDSLAQTVSKTAADPAMRGLSDELSALNKKYFLGKNMQPGLLRKAGATGGEWKGIIGTALGKGSDLAKRVAVLADIKLQQDNIKKLIASGTENFFKPAGAALRPVAMKALTTSSLARNALTGEEPKNRKEAFTNLQQNVTKLQSDPQLLQDRLIKSTAATTMAAPGTAQSMQNTLQAALAFLASKVPQDARGTALLPRPYQPSDAELAKLDRYMQAIEAPMTVFSDIAKGTLTQEHVEALKAVYPTLYNDIQHSMIAQLSQKGTKLSFSKRVMLGTLMDIPTDYMLQPQSIQMLQNNFSAQGTQQQQVGTSGAVKSSSGAMAKIEFSGRHASDTQSFMARRAKGK